MISLKRCIKLVTMKIKITINERFSFDASFNSSATAQKIYAALPIIAPGDTWGGEVYFSSQVVAAAEENARDVLEAGEIAYWPPMQAICLFYGPTPASLGDEIRAAGPVNVVGNISGDLSPLKQLKGTVTVRIEKGD